MGDDMDHGAEGYGLMRWLLTTLVVANGLALLALATSVFGAKGLGWIHLILVPSAVAFTLGLMAGGMAVVTLTFHHFHRGLHPDDAAMGRFSFATYAGLTSYVALMFGIAWPLIHIVAKASTGTL